MKIALIGGHPTPALAILDALPKEVDVVFIGRKSMLEGDETPSLEYRAVTQRGIRFIPISTGKLQRSFSLQLVRSLLKIPRGIIHALQILRKEKPAVVLSFGSYVSIPVCFAAYILRIPIVIHEQTLNAGLANKIIGKIATKICISWQQSARWFPKNKIVLTGNPMRQFQISNFKFQISNEAVPLLYITGGSTGAHAINLLIESCFEELLMRYRIVHQTGDAKAYGDYDRLVAARSQLSKKMQERYQVVKFVDPDEVGSLFRAATLIVSRSGMNTVTELLHFGKPCLLVPLPVGQKNEQLENAKFIKKIGIGDYIFQDIVTPSSFTQKLEHMVENIAQYQSHAAAAKNLVQEEAATHILDIVYETITKKKKTTS